MPMESREDAPLDAQELLGVLTALKNGDFTRLMPGGQGGVCGEIAETINTLVRELNRFASELTRISREIGTQGIFGGQARVEWLGGTWKDLTDNVNLMARHLTDQIRDLSRTAEGIVQRNPTRGVTVGARGETQELKERINRLVDRASGR